MSQSFPLPTTPEGVIPSLLERFKVNLTGSRSAGGQNDGSFLTADFGVDYVTTPGFLFGSPVEIDSTSQTASTFPTGPETDGSGETSMARPYMGLHLLPHLFVDARIAVGDSGDHVRSDGAL